MKIRNDAKITSIVTWDGSIHIVGTKKMKPLGVLKFHSRTANCIAFDPTSNRMAVGSKDTRISIWELY